MKGPIEQHEASFTLRVVPVTAFALGALAGCEHPLPPAGPAPREVMVAEALNVPVATIQAFEHRGVQVPSTSRPPDPSSPEVQHLRRVMASLEQSYSRKAGTEP
jgi:hypothetical protein